TISELLDTNKKLYILFVLLAGIGLRLDQSSNSKRCSNTQPEVVSVASAGSKDGGSVCAFNVISCFPSAAGFPPQADKSGNKINNKVIRSRTCRLIPSALPSLISVFRA